MAHTFSVKESNMKPLWDFGWFDLSRFEVGCGPGDPRDYRSILREFLRHPISRRLFCTSPDPWGHSQAVHGPFLLERLLVDWYRPVALQDLRRRVAAILDDPNFTSPPSTEQRQPVTAWLDATRVRGDDVFVLDAPALPGVRVDFDIWTLFHEFACFSPDRKEMTVVVIGYD